MKKHPSDLSDAEVDEIVAEVVAAVERGDVQVVDAVVLRELRAVAAPREDAPSMA